MDLNAVPALKCFIGHAAQCGQATTTIRTSLDHASSLDPAFFTPYAGSIVAALHLVYEVGGVWRGGGGVVYGLLSPPRSSN